MSEIRLMEYQGKYRLEQGNMGKDREGNEKWWPDKVKKQVWNKDKHAFEFEEKNSNMSMKLGDAASAKLLFVLFDNQVDAVEKANEPKAVEPEQVPIGKVPF